MKYKRFLVFQYAHCYPAGGFNDFTREFGTLDEAKQYLIESYECSKRFKRCEKCESYAGKGIFDELHKWEDANKVVDLIGEDDLNGTWFIENYKAMKEGLNGT
jgi:hypothetical protein